MSFTEEMDIVMPEDLMVSIYGCTMTIRATPEERRKLLNEWLRMEDLGTAEHYEKLLHIEQAEDAHWAALEAKALAKQGIG